LFECDHLPWLYNDIINTAPTFCSQSNCLLHARQYSNTFIGLLACDLDNILIFSVFRLLTDFAYLYTYEFWLSFCKIVGSLVILLLPLLVKHHNPWYTIKYSTSAFMVEYTFQQKIHMYVFKNTIRSNVYSCHLFLW
jgi:hypothetical protein